MAKAKRKIIVGNWKMAPDTLVEAKQIFTTVARGVSRLKRTQAAVCPPFLFFHSLISGYTGTRVGFGVQDIFYEESGAYTGEVSPVAVKRMGGTYAIVGHSERRLLGETNAIVAKKTAAALKAGLTPIICIGERTRDNEGKYLGEIKEQLLESLGKLQRPSLSSVIIAYEPIWAIGASSAMSPRDMHEMRIYIQKVLTDSFGKDVAALVRVLYGGSVDGSNAGSIVGESEVDGLLVGRQSLTGEGFMAILKAVESL